MARKEITITLDDRGNQLTFKIKEMPARKLEQWIIRAVLLLAGGGVELPDGADIETAAQKLMGNGASAIAKALGGLEYEKAEPLLDDLLTCCHKVIDERGNTIALLPETVDAQIEDVRTLFTLRLEALKVNFSFFGDGGLFSFPPKLQTEKATPSS